MHPSQVAHLMAAERQRRVGFRAPVDRLALIERCSTDAAVAEGECQDTDELGFLGLSAGATDSGSGSPVLSGHLHRPFRLNTL